MQYRFAQPDEIPNIARLVAHSFIGRSAEWWTEQLRDPPHGGGAETLLVGYDGKRAVAALQLHPLRQWVAGAVLRTAGVGSVSVSPTYRQRGIAGDLLKHALRAALERGDVASALYPFRKSFYQKSGYGLAGEAVQYLVGPEDLPASEDRRRVELLETDQELTEVQLLYTEWIKTQNGHIERTARDWARLTATADRGLVGYRNHEGELEGYAFVGYRGDLPLPKRYLDVEELVWTTPEARAGLYGWLASMGDQWERIMVRGLRSHHLGDVIREPRLPPGYLPLWGLWVPSAIQLMGPMFRILDMKEAWGVRATTADSNLSVALHVEDKQIEENSGAWHLRIENGQARATPGTGGGVQLRLEISTLSRLFIGSLKPTVAHELGLLECDKPGELPALDAALALPEPWMFDRF